MKNEILEYIYTEIYSYRDFSLIDRFDGFTPLSRAEIVNDGKHIIGFDYSKNRKHKGIVIIIWDAKDFTELKRSEPIGKEDWERLGIHFNKSVVFMYFSKQEFKKRGHDLEFADQYVIKLHGKDAERKNRRSVEFTLSGEPLLTLWHESGKVFRGYPSDYEKKFNVKLSPLTFNDVQAKGGKNKKNTMNPI